MKYRIEKVGLEKFLDLYYKEHGGFVRFKEMLERNYPLTVIGAEMGGVSRETVRAWKKLLI